MSADLLYDARTYFFIGDYAQCMATATSVPDSRLSESERIEKEYLSARSQIELGQQDVLLRDARFSNKSAPIALQACRLLAQYQSAQSDADRSAVLSTVDDWTSATPGLDALGPFASAICGILYMKEAKWDRAIYALHKVQSLEMSALLTECFIHISRRDLAEKSVQRMKQIDEDNVVTQLSWVRCLLAQADSSERAVIDAQGILLDLTSKYGESVSLLNSLAACAIVQQQFGEAEKMLLRALSKRANDTETLINMTVCAIHSRKPRDLINRYVSQVKTIAPSHPWVREWNARELALDQLDAMAR